MVFGSLSKSNKLLDSIWGVLKYLRLLRLSPSPSWAEKGGQLSGRPATGFWQKDHQPPGEYRDNIHPGEHPKKTRIGWPSHLQNANTLAFGTDHLRRYSSSLWLLSPATERRLDRYYWNSKILSKWRWITFLAKWLFCASSCSCSCAYGSCPTPLLNEASTKLEKIWLWLAVGEKKRFFGGWRLWSQKADTSWSPRLSWHFQWHRKVRMSEEQKCTKNCKVMMLESYMKLVKNKILSIKGGTTKKWCESTPITGRQQRQNSKPRPSFKAHSPIPANTKKSNKQETKPSTPLPAALRLQMFHHSRSDAFPLLPPQALLPRISLSGRPCGVD